MLHDISIMDYIYIKLELWLALYTHIIIILVYSYIIASYCVYVH